MTFSHRARAVLMCTTSLCFFSFSAGILRAQEAEDGFLGILILGESKREVQTGTATPITTVDQDEIDDRQAGTIAELIDSVPGVSLVNGSTPQGSGINIRGFGANGTYGTDQKVAVQIDGANVGAEELYRIGTQLFTDPFLYKSVSVIRGTIGSFEYGSGIIGGVVLLETKDASDFTGGDVGFVFGQTLEFASNGNGVTSSSVLAWQPTQDLEVLLNYTWRDQGLQQDGNGDPIGNSGFTLPSGLFKAKYTFGENREQSLTFSLSDTQSSERNAPFDSFTTAAGVFGNVDRDIASRTAVLKYTYAPIGNDLVNFTATLSYADQQIDQAYIPGSSSLEGTPGFAGLEPLVNADHRYQTTKLAFKNTSLFTTGLASHDLRTGLEFIRKTRLDASSAPGGTDRRLAVFAVDDITIGDAWTITPALRYETSTINGSTAPFDGEYKKGAVMGGLSVRYAFGNGMSIFGSAAHTGSLPIIDDLSAPTLITRTESSRTFELGTAYRGNDLFRAGDRFYVKGNLYRTSLSDVTSYTFTPAGLSASPLERVNTEGLEIEASYAMDNGVYIDLNANIVDGEEFQPGGAVADWRNTPADSLRVTIGRTFGEELDLSWEIVANASVDTVGNSSAGFVIHNLRATYVPQQGALKETEIRVGLENVFDHDHMPHLYTRPAPGRSLKLTLSRLF